MRRTGSVLSPWLAIRRNPARALPVAFVISLAVVLVASVVTIVDSINLTIYTLYGYNRYLTGFTPRNALSIPDSQVQRLRALPEMGPLFQVHSYQTLVHTIFGKMPLPIFGMTAAGRRMIMQRSGVRLIAGRMPVDGAPEAVVSADVARNLHIAIGGNICTPDSQDSYAPEAIKVTGLLRGPVWLALTSKAFVDAHSPFTYSALIGFAPSTNLAAQRRLDAAATHAVDRGVVRVWKYSGLVRETKSSLANLYLILDLVVGIIVFCIAFVCGLLSNIYFSQRLPEVATLYAIGHSRGFLLWWAAAETFIISLMGWLVGMAGTVALLQALRLFFIIPRGLLLNPYDLTGYVFAAPLPIAITVFAVITVTLRLRTLDPVSIIERRG